MGGRELSLSLIGLSGGLLVGNFAAFNGFLALADLQGDLFVTWLLTGSTALLTISVIFGGWGIGTNADEDPGRWYNAQAVAGLLGLVAALAMPISSLWFREAIDADQEASISVLRQALAAAEADRETLQAELDAAQGGLQSLSQVVDGLQQQLDDLGNP